MPDGPAVAELQRELGRVLEDPALRFARLGFRLQEITAAGPLLAHNDAMGFMPASNMKLISSAVALSVLGPGFRYETKLVGHGTQRGDVWVGDLVLVGSGDPTFGTRAFEQQGCTAPFVRMAEALAKAGIATVQGRVLGDDSVHPDEIMGRGWDWSYHADWYAAQLSGLCFNENCVDFLFTPANAGQPPLVRLEPPTSYVEVVNRVRCVRDKDTEVVFRRALGTNRITLGGTFPAAGEPKRDWGSVHNPTAFAATVLRETLLRNGIRVLGRAADADDVPNWKEAGAARVLYVHRSSPISEILVSLQKRSQNLYAEQVVRTAARKEGGEGSMAGARKVALRVLRSLGVPTRGLVMADGSGLTRLNLVQPRQLTALLAAMWRHEHREFYLASLPVAGVDGTLRRRFPAGAAARGRVRAKTGYISRVVALSGYVPRRGADPLVFSILVNDFQAETAKIKALVDRLVNRTAALAGPGGWTKGLPEAGARSKN